MPRARYGDIHVFSNYYTSNGNNYCIQSGREARLLVERLGDIHFRAAADVTIRGNTREVDFDVTYTGEWETPFWVGEENRGTMRRIGFEGRTTVNRHDWAVSWQDHIPGGGVVVSNLVEVVLDVEAIDLESLERTGAIDYYREDVEKLVRSEARE